MAVSGLASGTSEQNATGQCLSGQCRSGPELAGLCWRGHHPWGERWSCLRVRKHRANWTLLRTPEDPPALDGKDPSVSTSSSSLGGRWSYSQPRKLSIYWSISVNGFYLSNFQVIKVPLFVIYSSYAYARNDLCVVYILGY